MPGHRLVSIIVRTFNRSTALARAVESALAQTYEDIEVVVVNDASTDNTADVLRDLRKRDSRVTFHDNSMGKGSAGALQTGLKVASGRYIAFLDDDDEYTPEKIGYEIACFEANSEVDVVVSGVKADLRPSTNNDWVKLEFQPQMIFQPSSLLCKRDIFRSVNVRWGNMEWRDLAFQLYINNFRVLLVDGRYFKKNASEQSMGEHSLKRYEIALRNAQSYFEQSSGRPEHEIFKRYLANRHKSIANWSLKEYRFVKAARHLVTSYKTEGKLSNLIPFW